MPYVNNQTILDNAEEMDLYFMYCRSESALLEMQKQEVADRRIRRSAAWDNAILLDARTYDQYEEAMKHFIAAHNAVKSAEAVMLSTKARLRKYQIKFGNM